MDSIQKAISALRRGEMIILVDDEDRENEGDLVVAAEKITPEAINFMARHGRGLICLAMAPGMVERLSLPMMTTRNQSTYGTAFTVSIEARKGVTTGISAADRARTVRVAVAKNAKPEDVIMPGHIFPLRAREGGVIERGGQTEGSVDLARLAALQPAAVICEIMNEDGSMARLPALQRFARKYHIAIVSVKDLVAYRLRNELLVKKISEAKLPLQLASGAKAGFKIIGFRDTVDGSEHFALVYEKTGSTKKSPRPPLVRVHSECVTGDAFGSVRCDCGMQLQAALQMVRDEGAGAVVYVRAHEGRGIGLLNKIRAYSLQDRGLDTVEANLSLGFKPDLRRYGIAAQILRALGMKKVRLLTNNPQKIRDLVECGVDVVGRIPLVVRPKPENRRYLLTKQAKLGHLILHKEL
ncbi:MAG: 3,4-dihydroxy-2-butanone-4-phosphate synthase [Deltaproteobacteria bacterium]|nr:3,4-dihydroxy-2-butanone-4-phosphate synthase [Deltaproteobacteria bacterium]